MSDLSLSRRAARLLVVLLIDSVALVALAAVLAGFSVDDWRSALGLAVAMGLANAVVWPLLVRVALPFTVATLGLGALLLNAALLLLAATLDPDVHVQGLDAALAVVLGMTAITTVVGGLFALDSGDLWLRHVIGRQAKRSKL